MNPRTRTVVGVVVAVLLVFYFRGSFDTALFPLGLNFQKCGKNAFGAVFCGDDLKTYERQVVQPVTHASQELEQIERRAGQKLDEVERRANRVSRDAECLAYPRLCGY